MFITFLFSQCQSWRTGEVREDKNSGISLENATTAGEKVSKSREEAVGKGEEGTVHHRAWHDAVFQSGWWNDNRKHSCSTCAATAPPVQSLCTASPSTYSACLCSVSSADFPKAPLSCPWATKGILTLCSHRVTGMLLYTNCGHSWIHQTHKILLILTQQTQPHYEVSVIVPILLTMKPRHREVAICPRSQG